MLVLSEAVLVLVIVNGNLTRNACDYEHEHEHEHGNKEQATLKGTESMLTERDRRELEEEIGHSQRKDGACIEALKIVQRRRGWVDDDDLRDIALFLEMSSAEVESVATFYNLIFRKPVGRHIILICDSVSCWLMGYNDLTTRFRERLGIQMGETTEDGLFTLLPVPCLGACDQAPAIMIDDKLYGNLTPERIDAIIEEYLRKEA